MTTQSVPIKWPQGEDKVIELIYREGPDAKKAVPVSLSSGYDARMDLVVPDTRELVHSITVDDGDIDLGSGTNDEPNVVIWLRRAVTLPGGEVFEALADGVNMFSYDVFLRNTQTDKQVKILRGSVTIERSGTLWQ